LAVEAKSIRLLRALEGATHPMVVTSQKTETPEQSLFNLKQWQTSFSVPYIITNPNTNNMQTIEIVLCTVNFPMRFDPSQGRPQGGKQTITIVVKISIDISFAITIAVTTGINITLYKIYSISSLIICRMNFQVRHPRCVHK
jgi:hypothetical protein